MSGTIGDNTGKQSGVIASGAGGIDIVDTDPTASEGTVFFNTSDNVLKVFNNVPSLPPISIIISDFRCLNESYIFSQCFM